METEERLDKATALELRVVTLNCWGLAGPRPIGSADREKRLDALVRKLIAEKYDVVGLQEIWSELDYERVKRALSTVYRFSHYFYSGFTGSGVCVFSRHPIVSTLAHRYTLNGFPHHIHRGDWFGGKVVGLVVVEISQGHQPHSKTRLHFYVTHLHAEYNRVNDLYLPHRLAQAFELAQFVRHTAHGVDLAVLVGDLNMEPEDLGLKLVLSRAVMKDGWHEAGGDEKAGATCARPDNKYTSRAEKRECPHGKRIDYVLYKGAKAELERCEIALNEVPECPGLNYSDHVGVCAKFRVFDDPSPSSNEKPVELERYDDQDRSVLLEAIKFVILGERRARWDRRLYAGITLLLFAVIIATLNVDLYFPHLAVVAMLARFLITLIVGFCIWHGVVGLSMELKALKNAKQGMLQLLNDDDDDDDDVDERRT